MRPQQPRRRVLLALRCARAAPLHGCRREAGGLAERSRTGAVGARVGDRWVSAPISSRPSLRVLLRELITLAWQPRSSGPFGSPVGGSFGVADDFPVGDFTPGTKGGRAVKRA